MECKYCGTVNNTEATVCEICQAELVIERPLKQQTVVTLQDCYKTVPELRKMHTLDLLLLVSLIRAERTSIFNYMQMSKKAEEVTKVAATLNKNFFNDYTAIKIRYSIVSNVLKDRLGYVPQRIDEKFLVSYEQKMTKANQKKQVKKTTSV